MGSALRGFPDIWLPRFEPSSKWTKLWARPILPSPTSTLRTSHIQQTCFTQSHRARGKPSGAIVPFVDLPSFCFSCLFSICIVSQGWMFFRRREWLRGAMAPPYSNGKKAYYHGHDRNYRDFGSTSFLDDFKSFVARSIRSLWHFWNERGRHIIFAAMVSSLRRVRQNLTVNRNC